MIFTDAHKLLLISTSTRKKDTAVSLARGAREAVEFRLRRASRFRCRAGKPPGIVFACRPRAAGIRELAEIIGAFDSPSPASDRHCTPSLPRRAGFTNRDARAIDVRLPSYDSRRVYMTIILTRYRSTRCDGISRYPSSLLSYSGRQAARVHDWKDVFVDAGSPDFVPELRSPMRDTAVNRISRVGTVDLTVNFRTSIICEKSV